MTEQAETKELTITPDKAIVAVGSRIDAIINECLPVAAQESQNFVQALTLANGIKALRHIFLTDKHIKATVESMQNTHLGFMTDRTETAIWKSKQQGNKEIKPYRYEDVAEVCIEAMLKGYRITNNEFNMIAGRFYAAKNGKFRMINECEGITDFQFTTTSPAYDKEQGGVQYAKVQGFASWKKDGNLATLGSSTDAEDKLVFKIRVNKFMGEDAIIGKALSKLFSRVLMRIEGKIMPEATDISDDDIVDAEFENGSAEDLTEKIKQSAKVEEKDEKSSTEEMPERPCPYCQKDILGIIDLMREAGNAMFECPHCNKEGKIEDGMPIGSFPPDHTARNSKEFQQEGGPEVDTGTPEEWAELQFHDEWNKKQTAGYSTYVHKNLERFRNASPDLQKQAKDKWEKFYPDTPWPLDAPPETEENKRREEMRADARTSVLDELGRIHGDIINKATSDLGYSGLDRDLNLTELETLLKKCKEIQSNQKSKADDQRVSMVDAIEGSYTPEEISAALVNIERASLSGCSLKELGIIYDDLRKGEGGEDLA